MEASYAVIYFLISAFLFKQWLGDAEYFEKNLAPRKGAFAGASFVGFPLISFAVIASLVLLAIQCLGEISLNLVESQSKISYYAIFNFVAAAFVEELVFRGYLVLDKTKVHLYASILGFSLVFALAHPFLWDFSMPESASVMQAFSFDFSLKAFYSTFFIFINSIFFYALRFNKFNPKRSLIPCFVAHFAYNIGVYLIKIAQGFVE